MDIELDEVMNRQLGEIYFNPNHPGSYGGVDKLYRHVKDLGYDKEQVKSWLARQDVYTIYKRVTRKFNRPRVVVPKMDYQFDADTVNMVKYVKDNERFSYILIVVDIFTRFLWTVPLQTLTGKEMVKALSQIFSSVKPINFRSDMGSEWKNRLVEKYMKENKINHFMTTNEVKANFAERCIATVKMLMTRYMYNHQTHNWIDTLQNVTNAYNTSFHRSIKMTPKDARSADPVTLWRNQYIRPKKFIRKPNRTQTEYLFKINDKVRLSKFRKPFEKAYDQKWTDEIFIIANRETQQHIPLYTIKNWNNDPIIGKFYTHELEKVIVDDKTVYKIEKVLKPKRLNKVPGYMVKWLGWGNEHCSWVSAKDLKNIGKLK